MPNVTKIMNRYAAKILFQFRIDMPNDQPKIRTCEERIINFQEKCASDAEAAVIKYSKDEEFNYKNDDGYCVYFEYIGIMDLMILGIETEENEVWYNITSRLQPMERRNKFIPDKSRLSAFLNEERERTRKRKKNGQ